MEPFIEINDRKIGTGFPVYIVAELSANHSQSFEQAEKLLYAAKSAGADAVKVQTYTADTLTLKSDKECFLIKNGTPWDGRRLYDLYKEATMPWEWQPKLKVVANELGLDFFSTAFDALGVDFLEKMDVPVHKVSSFEIIDISLIKAIAKTGRPLIISTGMASFREIEEAVVAAKEAGSKEIVLLKCTSAYPALPRDMNLNSIPDMARIMKVPVGLSDHTLDPVVSAAAVALGACMIEKHLTMSRSIGGPDSGFSLEPLEFKELVKTIRLVESALGEAKYGVTESEKKSLIFRRSLFVIKDMKAGDHFNEENLRSIRPACGLAPRFYEGLLGRRASRDIESGTPLSWELVL